MSRKAWLAVLGVVLAAGAVAVAGWWWLGINSPGDTQPAATPSIVVRVPADPGEQQQFEDVRTLLVAMPADLAAGRTGGLVPELAGRADLSAALPADSVLTPDIASWRRTGDIASILTTISRPGQANAMFTVLVERTDGEWKVAGTYPGEQR